MTQVATPTDVTSTVDATTATDLDITWKGSDTGGNSQFSIQFVNRTNPADIVPAPSSPFTPTAPAAGTPYSQKVTFTTAAEATKYSDDYQAQVQALAATAADNSEWGKQTWWIYGLTLTITIGGNQFILTELPTHGIYRLPVSKAHPLTVTYDDLKAFVQGFNSGLTLPTEFPNGTPITGALNLSRFVVNTINKTFALDISVDANWELFTGFTFNSIGLDVQRTDGTPLPM